MNDDLLTPVSPAPLPVVFVRDGGVFANSRDVAAYFGKQHKDVLRAVDNLGCSLEFTERNFAPSEYTDPTGRKLRSFDMTKDGFAFLVMGFTGTGAARFKESYIAQFNAMESALRTPVLLDPMKVLNDPSAMRGLLLTYSEKVISLEAAVEHMRTDVLAFERIAKADGDLNGTEAAKALGIQRKKLFGWMAQNRWIYRRAGAKAWLGYQDKVEQGVLTHKVAILPRDDGAEKIVEQVLITPKGLAKLAKIFGGAIAAE